MRYRKAHSRVFFFNAALRKRSHAEEWERALHCLTVLKLFYLDVVIKIYGNWSLSVNAILHGCNSTAGKIISANKRVFYPFNYSFTVFVWNLRNSVPKHFAIKFVSNTFRLKHLKQFSVTTCSYCVCFLYILAEALLS